ncbi:MAG: anti-sigma factor family protein [Deltaproteobacteria bacterium]
MVTTCFLCQNLLSDYIEGILPAIRHEEIKKHLEGCSKCHQIHQDLIASMGILKELCLVSPTPELSVRIVEAAEAGKAVALRPLKITRIVLNYSVPILGLVVILFITSKLFPSLSLFQSQNDERQLVRYFPMSNGANEILDEQATWLHSRDPRMGSVWDEGGLSPEEFEKSFQKRGSINDSPE